MKKGRKPDMRIVLVWRYKDTNVIMWRCWYICTTRKESLEHERVFFFGIYCLSQRRNREYDPEGLLCMSVCVCVCVCARTCGLHVSEPLCQASLFDGCPLPHFQLNLSCTYMSFSRWSHVNLEVAGTAKTFLPKRAIHGATEEARLNSVRGFCVTAMVTFASSTRRSLWQ